MTSSLVMPSTSKDQQRFFMDTGYYKCEAYNGLQTISSETVIKVHLGNKRKYCN